MSAGESKSQSQFPLYCRHQHESIRTPPKTDRIVSSNWADLRPSSVTAVQSSFQCSYYGQPIVPLKLRYTPRLAVPALIMGSCADVNV